jgi:hypothetical protein
MAIPTLELFTHGLYVDDTTLKAAQAAWEGAQDSPRKGMMTMAITLPALSRCKPACG